MELDREGKERDRKQKKKTKARRLQRGLTCAHDGYCLEERRGEREKNKTKEVRAK
jgi:hypothetical protein